MGVVLTSRETRQLGAGACHAAGRPQQAAPCPCPAPPAPGSVAKWTGPQAWASVVSSANLSFSAALLLLYMYAQVYINLYVGMCLTDAERNVPSLHLVLPHQPGSNDGVGSSGASRSVGRQAAGGSERARLPRCQHAPRRPLLPSHLRKPGAVPVQP